MGGLLNIKIDSQTDIQTNRHTGRQTQRLPLSYRFIPFCGDKFCGQVGWNQMR